MLALCVCIHKNKSTVKKLQPKKIRRKIHQLACLSDLKNMLIVEYFLLSFLAFTFLSLFDVVVVMVDVDDAFDVVVAVVMVDVDIFDIFVIIAACCNHSGLYAAETLKLKIFLQP